MLTAEELIDALLHTFEAHANHPLKPTKATRKWDHATPQGVHPTWCAMTLLQEPTIPEELRVTGALALLFHDLLEDTTAKLPSETPDHVRALVEHMTFTGMADEMVQIWEKTPEVWLLKLYDKVSNLLDGQWLAGEKADNYKSYTLELADRVEQRFGTLNIVKIARAIAS